LFETKTNVLVFKVDFGSPFGASEKLLTIKTVRFCGKGFIGDKPFWFISKKLKSFFWKNGKHKT